MAKFYYAGLIVLALVSGCEGCQGGYLVQINDSGSDAGFAYLYDVSLPDMFGQDSNLPTADATSPDLDAMDAAIADQNLVDIYSDAQVEDVTSDDANIDDANLSDSTLADNAVQDSSLPDTAMPDTSLPDTFQPDTAPPPECVAGSVSCVDDHLIRCDAFGFIAQDLLCADFGCNAALIPNACRACDPDALHQCLEGQAVTCSSSGEVVVSEDCVYGCDTSDGTCDACDPDLAQQCIDDDAVQCSSTGNILSRTPCGESRCNPVAGQCNACTPEVDFCADSGDIMACDLDGSIGSLVQSCSYGCAEPVPGSPICLACEPSTLSCHDSALVQCDAAGNINSSQACDYGCAQAVGDDRCMACVPSTTACHADSSVVCSPDGYISTSTLCTYGCRQSDGLCQACAPSSSACQGDDWVVCTAEGAAESTINCAALGDTCRVGVCTPSGCDLDSSAREDQSCDDGLFCTVAATCQDGTCTRTKTRVCTDDNNACTQDRCDATLDTCVYDSVAREGAACDDSQICTVSTTCHSGNCEGGSPLDCSDSNPCTEEHCDPDTGCTTHDATALENSRCGDASAGEEKICCSGTCTDSDVSNCGQCGSSCGAIGACSAACLHYSCIHPDMVVITELMINPTALDDADGEWIELYNPSSNDINMQNWIIEVTGDTPHEISQSLVVPADGYAVLSRNQTSLAACAIPNIAENIFVLGNGGDEVVLKALTCEIDRVSYGSSFDVAGYSQQLSLDHYGDDNNDLSNWCNSAIDSVGLMSCGETEPFDIASPGAANAICP